MSTGEKSQWPLTQLAAKFNQMRSHGQLLSNRDVLEILQDRVAQLLERIDANQAADRVGRLQELWEEFKIKDAMKDPEALMIRKLLDAEFERAYHDYASWKQLMEIFDLKRKTAETEVKIAKEINAIMTAEQGYELVAEVFAVILRVVTDPDQLRQIQYELTRLVGDRPLEKAGRGGGQVVDA